MAQTTQDHAHGCPFQGGKHVLRKGQRERARWVAGGHQRRGAKGGGICEKERRPSFLWWVVRWLYPCFLRGLWQASLDGGAFGLRIWKDLETSRGASPLYRSLLCVLRHETRRIYSKGAGPTALNLTAYRCMGVLDFLQTRIVPLAFPPGALEGGGPVSVVGRCGCTPVVKGI